MAERTAARRDDTDRALPNNQAVARLDAMDQNIWHGRRTPGAASVLIGVGVHCAGCGHSLGVVYAAIEPDRNPPPDPDWPYPESACLVCVTHGWQKTARVGTVELAATYHIGRSWTGHKIEDRCGCPKGACGLVAADLTTLAAINECPHHGPAAAKIRQAHHAAACPALDDPCIPDDAHFYDGGDTGYMVVCCNPNHTGPDPCPIERELFRGPPRSRIR